MFAKSSLLFSDIIAIKRLAVSVKYFLIQNTCKERRDKHKGFVILLSLTWSIQMETKNLSDLKPDPKNPRRLSEHDGKALKNSLDKFGDLGCIVFNVRTQQLVGGHQRLAIMEKLNGERKITITDRYETPDEVGTIAIGYVWVGNKQFAYREVEWDIGMQRAANVAANRISGEFDLDLLAEVNYELSQLENGADLLALSGQTEQEISQLLKSVSGEEEEDKYTKEIVAPTYEPNNEKPNVKDLVNREKTNKLIAEIDSAEIDESEKEFLRLAANRHTVFDYSKIADYYAHSSKEVQEFMENSALVIVDYNKALENGFVELTKDINEIQEADYND